MSHDMEMMLLRNVQHLTDDLESYKAQLKQAIEERDAARAECERMRNARDYAVSRAESALAELAEVMGSLRGIANNISVELGETQGANR